MQNFSNTSMHYAKLTASFQLNDIKAADLVIQPDIDIPGESADVVEAIVTPATDAAEMLVSASKRPDSSIRYFLRGEIVLSEPKRNYPFEHGSHLSPVPGLKDVFR